MTMVAMTVKENRQNGLSLVLAIFVLVIMSLLAAALINITSTGAESVAREVLSVRALLAAESGAQVQLSEIFPAGAPMNTDSCAASQNTWETSNYTLGGLLGCSSVSVQCKYVVVDGVNYFSIASTGSCGPAGDAATRVIEVQAKGS